MVKILHQSAIRKAIKIIIFLYLVIGVCQSEIIGEGGISGRCHYKDYDYQNSFSDGAVETLDAVQNVSQSFIAKGNILNNIWVYIADDSDQIINIAVLDQDGRQIAVTDIALNNYNVGEWNKIAINSGKLKRNKQYDLVFTSEKSLQVLLLDTEEAPIIFKECKSDGELVDGSLAVGFQFTYSYLTLGSILEFIFHLIFILIMTLLLSYTIWNFERMYDLFSHTQKKKGLLYAIYFSVSFALVYNPIDPSRSEVSEFKRMIGVGLAHNVDVSKRINSFNQWFVLFGIAFLFFWMLMNYFLQQEKSAEGAKIISFTDDFIVLADCSLLLRCINYFSDHETVSNDIFRFSSEVIMLIVLVMLAYVVLGIDRNIRSDVFSELVLAVSMISCPVSVFIALEMEEGKVVLGVMATGLILVLIFCRYERMFAESDHFEYIVTGGVLVFSLIPIVTSGFIELVHVLNQYSVFLGHPGWYYAVVMIILFGGFVVSCWGMKRKTWIIKNWKSWSYPWIVFGIACLSVQIPIQSTYSPNIYEDANYGVLISDFLNFGKIPIVEHYGGHMMTGVWEGILYGIINNDYAGAILSPYSGLLTPFLALLFFYFVKKVWSEDIALFVAVLFPYMDFWSYYGLGMMVCSAALLYVKKNSYMHAVILWLAFFWCAVYRLDLGFAFGIAVIVSMIVYVISERNMTAFRQLGLTLIGFGVICGIIWSFLCMIKGINPLGRLIEFLMLSMSNQNWAYTDIGDSSSSVFSWIYAIIPFTVIICTVYTVFSKDMKARIGCGKWMLLMVLGFSYFANFSRGLVRHSLAEGLGDVVIWSSYLFLAMFLSCLKNNNRLLLPVFMFLILCNTLFTENGRVNSIPIADMAVSRPSAIIESWKINRFDEEEYDELKLEQDRFIAKGEVINENDRVDDSLMSYWQKVKNSQEVVERVRFDDEFMDMVNSYAFILDVLLDENDTFVDFANKTLLYSVFGRENPVYISQSPLQLSGDFSQEQFIKEIRGIPVVLMPLDPNNAYESCTLDNIANAYRNYKVSEYIYQQYVPLCKYEISTQSGV